jgi:hypothetical protein
MKAAGKKAVARTPTGLMGAVRDTFQDDRRAGRVAGTRASDGSPRLATDDEGVLSIDHGALRIGPLTRQGWGRVGIAYGPLEARPGLVLAALVLNGHHNAQTYRLKSVTRQVIRWLVGSHADGIAGRVYGLAGVRKRQTLWMRLAGWTASRRAAEPIVDNLVFGFAREAPLTMEAGPGLAVRAAGPQNGHLMARVARRWTPVVRGLPDLPLYLVVALREGSAAYYVASLAGARGCAGLPEMRPLAVDPESMTGGVVAGIAQSAMAEIGFSIDTRVSGVAAGFEKAHAPWQGLAHLADPLVGSGPLHESDAPLGAGAGMWRCVHGSFSRFADGTACGAGETMALVESPSPSGLIHALVRAGDGEAGLVFRAHDGASFWRVVAGRERSSVVVRERGKDEVVVNAPGLGQHAAEPVSVQVNDDGRWIEVSVNGVSLTVDGLKDPRLGAARGVGIYAGGGPGTPPLLTRFEAHPRRVAIPASLDLGRPWSAEGTRVLVHDDFRGAAGELSGRVTPVGERAWTRDVGRGRFVLTGENSARVDASVGTPAPGRIVYGVPWEEPGFADVEVQMVPPGTGPGQAQRCRAGLVFWQDRKHYVMMNLWLDEAYGAASLSCFWRLEGYEDTYDAVWTNLGERVRWGRPAALRIAFDGNRFLARVDGEPVLYRALTDVYRWTRGIEVRKIGLISNWEWGTDTGTVFRGFTGRGR